MVSNPFVGGLATRACQHVSAESVPVNQAGVTVRMGLEELSEESVAEGPLVLACEVRQLLVEQPVRSSEGAEPDSEPGSILHLNRQAEVAANSNACHSGHWGGQATGRRSQPMNRFGSAALVVDQSKSIRPGNERMIAIQ